MSAAPLASLFSKVAERSGVERRLGPKKNMLSLPVDLIVH